jgi:hypothetical protein
MIVGKDAFTFHVGIGSVLMLLIYGGTFVVRMIVDHIFMIFLLENSTLCRELLEPKEPSSIQNQSRNDHD